jgi:hypothetical protein
MVEKTICGYCARSFSYKKKPIPLYCSKRCQSLGHKQKIESKRKKFMAITKCVECGIDISNRILLKPICSSCKKRKKRDFQKQICSPSKIKIEPQTPPEYMERGDLCFLKEDRLKRVEFNE